MLTAAADAFNRILDRAGRHRRLATASVLLVPTIAFMAVRMLMEGYQLFAVYHLAVAGSFALICIQLLRFGSLVDGRGVPSAGMAGLFPSVLMIRFGSPAPVAETFGAVSALRVGFGALALGMVLLAVADRRPDATIRLAGRGLLVLGAALSGVVQLIRVTNGFADYPGYAVGLAVVGALLLATSFFEGRLLRRAMQLARLSRVD